MDSYEPLYEKQKPDSFQKRRPDYLGKHPRQQPDYGRDKRQNIHRDDTSLDSKTIETIYRILCPVKSVGSVLGKGGSIVNALRDETHAKIRVADSIPGANDRVVIIFSYILSESRRDVSNEDGSNSGDIEHAENEHGHMQPHCAAQDALLKVHDRIAAEECTQGDVAHDYSETDNIVTARLLVPNNQVGCLIGKGGDIIQKLRSDTGANIRILSAEILPACAMRTDELVQISGVPYVVKRALYDISTLLHQHPRKENPPLDDIIIASTQGLHPTGGYMDPALHHKNAIWSPEKPGLHVMPQDPLFRGYDCEASRFSSNSYDHVQTQNDGELAEEFLMKIVCPAAKIGGVIGKGGINVRQLEQCTGANIHVESTAPESDVRVIHVSSKEAPRNPFSSTIKAVLQLQGKTSEVSDAGIVTTMLLVPSSKAGCLLGQGGHIINEMRRRTKADIRIFPKNDKPEYASTTEEIVQISGNHVVARDALSEIASRLRERTLLGGNSAGNLRPAGPFHLHGFSHQENLSGRRLPPSDTIRAPTYGGYEYLKMKDAQVEYEAKEYQFPSAATRYPIFNSPVDYNYRNGIAPSVIGMGGSNAPDIHQMYGARVQMYDPQLDAFDARQTNSNAHSRYYSFIASGRYQTQQSRPY